MSTTLDKQMRISEWIASLITIFLFIIFEIFIRTQRPFVLGLNSLEDVSILMILLMFLFGKFRNTPWNKAVGVLYAAMTVPQIGRGISSVRALFLLKDSSYHSFIPMTASSLGYHITFMIGAVICVLMYMGVVSFRKRRGLLILMYALIVFGMWYFVYYQRSMCGVLVVIWGICFHNENAETGCKKGKAARTAILLIIPLMIVLAIALYMSIFMSFTAHITEDDSDVTAFMILLGIAVICFVCIMLFPLLLFDKKFESRETNEKTVL